ncbi:MAG: lipocalin-like domain-containing protein [Thermodesulfobacteriota bacterium]|nr:lipocalin-like domain-containing protein [Thermodesulfobacteriota bacterium]
MVKFKWFVIVALFLIAVQPSFADDRAKILGIWQLVSFELEFQPTGEREHIRGKNPTGYIIFTPEGRMMVVLTDEGRKAPKTDQDRADLFKSVIAYTGMYRIEGDKWITKVDVSGNPAWVGTEQARFFRVDGDRLHVISSWLPSPTTGRIGWLIITWERAK